MPATTEAPSSTHTPALEDAVKRSVDHMLQELLTFACTISPHPSDDEIAEVLYRVAGEGASTSWCEFVEELGFVK